MAKREHTDEERRDVRDERDPREERDQRDERVASIVHLVRELHDVDWGDWSLAALRKVVAARPGWELGKPGAADILLRTGPDSPYRVIVRTGKHGLDVTQYDRAGVWLGNDWGRGGALAGLVAALSEVGRPTVHRGSASHPTLRWRNEHRLIALTPRVLHGRVTLKLAIRPTATRGHRVPSAVLAGAADVVGALHDLPDIHAWRREELAALAERRPGWEFLPDEDGPRARLRVGAKGGDEGVEFALSGETTEAGWVRLTTVRLLTYPEGSGLVARREAFGELLDAVVGAIGDPTDYGGAADGPDVRWRTTDRLLRLRGDRGGAWLQVHDTEELENEEHRTFEWGGAWSADEPSDFRDLPYLWQLDREGPGDAQTDFPGGRIAAGFAHLRQALELMLAGWIEQIPAQLGEDWVVFRIVNRTAGNREILVAFDVNEGLSVRVGARDGDDSPEAAETMRARGWQECSRGDWLALFPEPTEESARAAARLIVTDLQAEGEVTDLREHLSVRDVSAADDGRLSLPGLGIGR